MRIRLERYSLVDKFFELIERQRPSDRLIMRSLFFIIIGTGIYFLLSLNNEYGVSVPAEGGSMIEGIVGIPRFINPALALTRADQDTTALVYSGLLRIGEDGNLNPDLAESISVSDDGLTYHAILKKDQFFHDGKEVSADDVIFTIELMKNPDLKSPLRGNWNDVTIEKISDYELNFILKEAYSPFIENFTIGIMPQHIWGSLPIEQLPFSQYNTEPIGSGPFSIDTVHRDNSGLINGYTLKPEPSSQGKANLDKIELKFFQNEDLLSTAFSKKEINSTIFLPPEKIAELDKDDIQIISQPLPRIFGIFLNQNRSPALRDKSARQALNIAVDREQLINEVLGGYGVPTTRPILTAQDELKLTNTDQANSSTSSLNIAREILVKGGWTQNNAGFWEKEIDKSVEILSITIRTSNTAVFDKTATIVADNWRKLGVEVQIEQYEQTGLVQSVIRTRDFQALLFGLDMNRIQDLYPFWHSSQKNDPGLNISQYTNITVDQLLEKARTTTNETERQESLTKISDIISEEIPAIFLFAPNVTYVIDKDIKFTPITTPGKPSDRFMNITTWHAKTETIWTIFRKDNQ